MKGTPSPDARRLVEAPQHSLGCANCHLQADRLLVAQIRACSRLLSPTPFFFFFKCSQGHQSRRRGGGGAAQKQKTTIRGSSVWFFSGPCLHRPTPRRARSTRARGGFGAPRGHGRLVSFPPECRDRRLRRRVCLRPPPVATDGSSKLQTPARVLSLLQRNPGVEPGARPPAPRPPSPRSGLAGGCAEKTNLGLCC